MIHIYSRIIATLIFTRKVSSSHKSYSFFSVPYYCFVWIVFRSMQFNIIRSVFSITDRLELRDEWRLENRKAFANIWSDMLFGISVFLLLYFNQNQVSYHQIIFVSFFHFHHEQFFLCSFFLIYKRATS